MLNRYPQVEQGVLHYNEHKCMQVVQTGPDGAVAMSSANGLVGNEFASRYRL